MDLSKKSELNILPLENKKLSERLLSKIQAQSRGLHFGRLQEVFLKFCLVHRTTHPKIIRPEILLFAGDQHFCIDHTLLLKGETTHDLILDLLNDTAPLSALTRDSPLKIRIVDAGVDHSFEGTLLYWLHQGSKLFNRKVGYGARNFTEWPAMTSAQVEKAMKAGMDMAEREHQKGCNTLGLSVLGRGNEISAALLCASLLKSDLEMFADALPARDEKCSRKLLAKMEKTLKMHPKTHDPLTLLALFGGFELAALCGAILKGAELRMLILLDGFSALTALLIASREVPGVEDYCLAGSSVGTISEKLLMDELRLQPLIELGTEMGPGCGIALSFPLVGNAILMINEMLSDAENEGQSSGHA